MRASLSPTRSSRPDAIRLVFTMMAVGATYYVAAKLSLRVALVEENVTPLWPPIGIAVAAFLLFGRRVWPGVAIAALAVNLPISTNLVAAAVTAFGNTLAPLASAELLQLAGFRREIDRLRDAVAIVAAALVGTLISATIGTTALVVSGRILEGNFPSAWAVWWTGDAMGILVVTPFLLSLFHLREWARSPWRERIEVAVLLGLLALTTTVMAQARPNMLFAVLPLVGWAAWRFQQRASAPATLLVCVIATWAVGRGWGPFAGQRLFANMLTLQLFNATVAFSSFFLAALVTDRMRSRHALELAAAELEERVRTRTGELRERERQLADAQHIAHLGSWQWLFDEDRMTWSDEMYRIHGYLPQEFPITFERSIDQVLPDDSARVRANVTAALESGRAHVLPAFEYRIRRPDGEERALLGRARLEVDPEGRPIRMVGTVQDVTEDKRAEREHAIAETLQRSLLPERMPQIPGVHLAARYVPASAEAEVGGDWYDVMLLPDGNVGVAIGDVAGHGLRAAAVMGQLRMALRAYAVEEDSPARVVARLQGLMRTLLVSEMATLVYLVFDQEACAIRFANAGHPPPLLVSGDGSSGFLVEGLAPPLGAAWFGDVVVDVARRVPEGSTLLLFTDGLIERRGDSLRTGLARLQEEAKRFGPDPEAVCDQLVRSLLGPHVEDDVAVLALRPASSLGAPLLLRIPAEPRSLAPLRHTIRRWLREAGADEQERFEILVACGEACSNAIQHPHGAVGAELEVRLAMAHGQVEFEVRDFGTWRQAPSEGGLGMPLMRKLMHAVEVDRRPDGTVVRLRRRLGGRIGEPARQR